MDINEIMKQVEARYKYYKTHGVGLRDAENIAESKLERYVRDQKIDVLEELASMYASNENIESVLWLISDKIAELQKEK